jgi:acyl-CoA thioesterase-1
MRTALALLCFPLLASPCLAQKKPDPMTPIMDDPALPRVLLIGDSISIGYTLPARAELQGVANVHRIPTNGGPTSNGLVGYAVRRRRGRVVRLRRGPERVSIEVATV